MSIYKQLTATKLTQTIAFGSELTSRHPVTLLTRKFMQPQFGMFAVESSYFLCHYVPIITLLIIACFLREEIKAITVFIMLTNDN